MFSGWKKKKHGNSQKSNDRILLVYLIVLTIDGNYGLQAKRDSVFGIVFAVCLFTQSEFFSFKEYQYP